MAPITFVLHALFCALLLAPLRASPQDAKTQQGEQILVTGSRIAHPVTESAQEIKLYTKDQIDESGAQTLVQFLNLTPEVAVSMGENDFQTHNGPPGFESVESASRHLHRIGIDYRRRRKRECGYLLLSARLPITANE